MTELVGKRVTVNAGYLPDRPRWWSGILQGEWPFFYIENEHCEVNFSAREVEHINGCEIFLKRG